MALHGSLRDLRLGDVLQTVLSSGGQGVLRVRSSGRRAVLHLQPEGLRILEPEVIDDRRILDAIVRTGAADPAIVERARTTSGGKSPLDALLASNSVTKEGLDAILFQAAEEAVLDVFSWP